jgi:hypothetical protein
VEVKNRREDLYTEVTPPVVEKAKITQLVASDQWTKSADTLRTQDHNVLDYDLLLVSVGSDYSEECIGIMPTYKLADVTKNVEFVLVSSTKLTVLQSVVNKKVYWNYSVNQIYNKKVFVYGIKL